MKGYFAIGAERMSKAGNFGALLRTGHAFGASFAFTIDAQFNTSDIRKTDTSKATESVPYYHYKSLQDLNLPKNCKLVGIEITDDAVELPSFHHPRCAAYILGPERGELSKITVKACDYIIKIPTKFCVNVSLAGGIVLYDRLISLGRFSPRPFQPGKPEESVIKNKFGKPIIRQQ